MSTTLGLMPKLRLDERATIDPNTLEVPTFRGWPKGTRDLTYRNLRPGERIPDRLMRANGVAHIARDARPCAEWAWAVQGFCGSQISQACRLRFDPVEGQGASANILVCVSRSMPPVPAGEEGAYIGWGIIHEGMGFIALGDGWAMDPSPGAILPGDKLWNVPIHEWGHVGANLEHLNPAYYPAAAGWTQAFGPNEYAVEGAGGRPMKMFGVLDRRAMARQHGA